ncbi:NYN domain-containing protein [Candidatus Kaiserbacteria bacterium]|nr:NYN domain-containing protein [Candidatus Kaiserbacteria bacterium]
MIFSKRDRVAIYFDGNNTYNKLKGLGLPERSQRFSFAKFAAHLVGEDRELVSKRYYVGIVRNHDNSEKGEAFVKGQQKFLDGLRTDGFDVKPGRIMYDGKDRIREKGVDVKLAVDLVIGAADDMYDVAIVVSSDTDLIPAIKYVRNGKNKVVEYIGFAGMPSIGMVKECNTQRLFSKEDLLPFQVDKPSLA